MNKLKKKKLVYAVILGREYDFELEGIFATRKKAQAYINKKLNEMKEAHKASAPTHQYGDNGFDEAKISCWYIDKEN